MGSLIVWLNENWFALFQTFGIGGSLLFAAATLREDVKAKRAIEYLTLATQHRRLWGQLHRRPKLSRLLDKDRDLATTPVAKEEGLFLGLAFVHFHTGWLLARGGSLTPLPVLAADAGDFFSLPAPAHVWLLTKDAYEPDFVEFVDRAVAARQQRQGSRG